MTIFISILTFNDLFLIFFLPHYPVTNKTISSLERRVKICTSCWPAGTLLKARRNQNYPILVGLNKNIMGRSRSFELFELHIDLLEGAGIKYLCLWSTLKFIHLWASLCNFANLPCDFTAMMKMPQDSSVIWPIKMDDKTWIELRNFSWICIV